MPTRPNKQRAELRIMQSTIKKRRGRRKVRINKIRLIILMAIIIVSIFFTGMLIKKFVSNNKNKSNVEIEINNNQTEIVDNEIDCDEIVDNEIDSDENVDKIDGYVDKIDDDVDKTKISENKEKEDAVLVDNENNFSEENPKANREENSSTIDEKDFNGCVFYGDSITQGISFYDTLDDSYVVAIKGLHLSEAAYESNIDKVKALDPKKVFVLLGTNDLPGNVSEEIFSARYVKVIKKMKEELPNADIYIQSILPVADKVQNKKHLFSDERIQKLNSAIKKITEDEGVHYINLFDMVNGLSQDIYEPDGEHFKAKFTKIWLNYIKDNVL